MKTKNFQVGKAQSAAILAWAQSEEPKMTNQTVITSQDETVYGVMITGISYKGFWTYGVYNGSVVRMYEGWTSWEVVR